MDRTDSRRRMGAILMVFVLVASLAVVRLGYWQVIASPELAVKAVRSMRAPEVVHLARAPIVDRNGQVLARTVSLNELAAHPDLIDPDQREGVVDGLGEILDLSAGERSRYMAALSEDGSQWESLRPRLSQEESAAIGLAMASGDLPGITLAPHDVRRYPGLGGQGGTTLASQLLGFVTADGRGGAGVERVYDDRLTTEVATNPDVASLPGMPIDVGTGEAPPLALTIDHKLQRQLEKELASAYLTTKAKSVSAIVMDPYTGEILASGTAPGYDANDYAEVASKHMSLLRNSVVSDIFDPGSVMKIFTVTAALDLGVVTPRSMIRDVPSIQFYKYRVDNSDKKGMGLIRVKDVIAYSRNVGTAKIAAKLAPGSTRLAARRLYQMWDTVGLVGKTGVDISGEEAGLYCDPDAACPWAPVDLANRAFGQSVSATLLQLANGVSTLVNGGFRVQPHVVAEGELAQVPKQRVLRAKVAQQAQEILEHVTGAVPGYAEGSLIPGYMIGGKTGTAQIWDNQRNRWKPDIFNRNFVGYVGGNKPEVVIALRIEEPKVKIHGQGRIETKIESYELFRNIAEGAIKHLGIRKSKDRNAGLPIIGTQAARVLTPERDRAGRAQRRQTDGGSDSTVEQRKKGSKSKQSDLANAGSDPDGVEGQSDGSEP